MTCARASTPRRSTTGCGTTRTKYPSYVVLVRTVDLSRERGQTEKLKVGSVIYRELLVAAAESGVILGAR